MAHQKKTIRCLKIQGIKNNIYKCDHCNKYLSTKQHLIVHTGSCTNKKINDNIKKIKIQYDSNILELNIYIKNLEKNIVEQKIQEQEQKQKIQEQKIYYEKMIENLQNKLENIALKAVEKPFNEIYMDNEEYKLLFLDIGDGYNIEHREKDGYINVTNLCKAGGKKFSDWKRIEKTQSFLQVLSSSMVIHINELIRYKIGSIHERATWVHPHVAINIAQWISPEFDVKVSAWVYEAMMTGKVDISNTKTYKEIQKENKTLKNKYVKRRPRIEYKEKYVIYILTTRLMQKERRYIMGKATNLTSRLSTYNKSDEHRVVYHQECGDEETMSVVENVVFHHLHKYREQANRERFILPEKEEITLFSNIIKKSIEYCRKPNP
jgi:hypothetical protein